MTIYYYGIYNKYGGLEAFAFNLIRELSTKDDLCFCLLVEDDDFAYKKHFLEMGIDYKILPSHRFHPFAFRNALLSILRKSDPGDIFQMNVCSYRNGFLFSAAKKSGIRSIVVGHLSSDFGRLSHLLHLWNRFWFRKLGAKIAVDERAVPYMYGKGSGALVIHNGIDLSRFRFNSDHRRTIRHELGISDSEVLIGLFGRICKQKNPMFAIESFLDADRPDAKLILFGNRYDERLAEETEQIGDDRIILFGEAKGDMGRYYSACDAVLVPSIKEGGLSLAFLEAACSGCQVAINEGLGRANVDLANVTYLPLIREQWAAYIKNLSAAFDEVERTSGVSQLVATEYDIAFSAGQYLQVYKSLPNY